MYPADGGKVFDVYAWPHAIRTEIEKNLGEFPFPCFWGPAAGVDTPQGPADAASRWIAESAKWIENKYQPTLSLVYLPHLDYNLQRNGPSVAADVKRRTVETPRDSGANPPPHVGGCEITPAISGDLRQIDAIVGELISFFQRRSVQVLLLSEYGIASVDAPMHLNRLFREKGWITVKDELGLEVLDCGASKVFAVSDHQVAHIYLNDLSFENRVRELLEGTSGVTDVMDAKEKIGMGINHPRAGDLIAVAAEHSWFTYYYWLDDRKAPVFARSVDIHRKPGYDPLELFLDPKSRAQELKILWRLLQTKNGYVMFMGVTPLDATLLKGSHGCRPANTANWPILIADQPSVLTKPQIESAEVFQVSRQLVAGSEPGQ